MKMKKLTTWTVILLGVFYSSVLYAETFQSEVRSVNSNSNMITVVKKDPVTGTMSAEDQRVLASKKTKFGNLDSLSDLSPGDEVEIEGKWNKKRDSWDAKSLSVEKVKLSDDTKKK